MSPQQIKREPYILCEKKQVADIIGVEYSPPSCAVKVLPVIIGANIDKRRVRSTCRRLEKAITQA